MSDAESAVNEELALGAIIGEELERQFGPHLVALGVWLTPLGSEQGPESHALLYSGFVIEVENRWFWVSAGHILNQIEIDKSKGFYVSRCALLEPDKPRRAWIDLSYETLQKDYVDEDKDMDLGWFLIPDLQRRMLEKGGLCPLSRNNVMRWDDDYDGYVVVGIPTEFCEIVQTAGGETISYATVVLILRKIGIEVAESGMPRLIFQARRGGAIVEGRELESICGMSGGPVIALKKDGERISYALVGIQSAWDPATWQLKAMPLLPLVEYLRELPEPTI